MVTANRDRALPNVKICRCKTQSQMKWEACSDRGLFYSDSTGFAKDHGDSWSGKMKDFRDRKWKNISNSNAWYLYYLNWLIMSRKFQRKNYLFSPTLSFIIVNSRSSTKKVEHQLFCIVLHARNSTHYISMAKTIIPHPANTEHYKQCEQLYQKAKALFSRIFVCLLASLGISWLLNLQLLISLPDKSHCHGKKNYLTSAWPVFN